MEDEERPDLDPEEEEEDGLSAIDVDLIQSLARVMKRSALTELEIDDAAAGLRIQMKRGSRDAGGALVNVLQGGTGSSEPRHAESPTASSGGGGGGDAGPAPVAGTQITSPMVGTFYRASSPDAEPFVTVGQKVEPDTVICIIEAMKVMNEIKAETSGVVADILVENSDPVEYGQPLFVIRKD